MRFRVAAARAAGACMALAAAAHAAPAPLPPQSDQALGREIFSELVGIRSTHDAGSTAIAHAIEQRLLAAGFTRDEVVFLAPPEHPSKGNLIVRLHGRSRTRPVLFLGHLDVVDARPEDWSLDPFKLTERDGWFYGRGAIDMKDGDAALVAALIRLRRTGYVPRRDLIVALTADEEAGGDANGPAFLLQRHRGLIDAGYAINLDGGGGDLVHGRRVDVQIGTSEKTYATWTLEATGPGGHGSLPGPDNPIVRLAEGLGRLAHYPFPVMVTATTRASFERKAELDPGPQSADLRALAQRPPDPQAAARLSAIPYWNAQLRTTCVPTLIAGGHAENALPQRARATIQCRLMPGDAVSHVEEQLAAALADPQLQLHLDAPPIVSPESAPTPAILALAGRVTHSMWPGVVLVPTMATGFSDDRQTRNAGIPSYDLSGVFMEVDENRAHGRDERVGVREFLESLEYTFRLMKAAGDDTSIGSGTSGSGS